MHFTPFMASGAIVAVGADYPNAVFQGSAARYMRPDIYITARHCVPVGVQLVVVPTAGGGGLRVLDVMHHPNVDLALVRTVMPTGALLLPEQVYGRPADRVLDGAEFLGHGYPGEDGADPLPPARTVRGYVQRLFQYQGYLSIEMSIPAPIGLSGTVLSYFREPGVAPNAPIAVVTANSETFLEVDRVTYADIDGKVRRTDTVKKIVTFGIAAWLQSEVAWLDEQMREIEGRYPF